MKESRLDLDQCLAQIIDFLADMRRHVCNQHKTEAHRALNQMGERKMCNDALGPIFQFGKTLQVSIDHPDHQVTMRDHRGLRRAGGTRSVDKNGDIVRFDRGDAPLKQVRLGVV